MTTFTTTWNPTFEAQPSDSENVSLGAGRIRTLKESISERMEVDHSFAGDADDGAHKKVTLLEQGSDPSNAANTGFVYSKDVSGITELFYEDSAGTVTQLTQNGGLALMPPGVVSPFAGSAAPTGWLLCAGQTVSRTTYARLFTAISTTYGVGDGSTTFNLPDLRGRAVFGKDNMNSSDAGRLTTGTGRIDGDTLGASGGAQTHTLTSSEMPSHVHSVTDPGHTHAQQVGLGSAYFVGPAGQLSIDAYTSTGSATTGISLGSTGGDQAHNNVPPGLILNYIIKT